MPSLGVSQGALDRWQVAIICFLFATLPPAARWTPAYQRSSQEAPHRSVAQSWCVFSLVPALGLGEEVAFRSMRCRISATPASRPRVMMPLKRRPCVARCCCSPFWSVFSECIVPPCIVLDYLTPRTQPVPATPIKVVFFLPAMIPLHRRRIINPLLIRLLRTRYRPAG